MKSTNTAENKYTNTGPLKRIYIFWIAKQMNIEHPAIHDPGIIGNYKLGSTNTQIQTHKYNHKYKSTNPKLVLNGSRCYNLNKFVYFLSCKMLQLLIDGMFFYAKIKYTNTQIQTQMPLFFCKIILLYNIWKYVEPTLGVFFLIHSSKQNAICPSNVNLNWKCVI